MSVSPPYIMYRKCYLQVVFPFPDVYFYSRKYGNGSSHSRNSRAPGNDVYYEGLMTEKIYYQRVVRKCYY